MSQISLPSSVTASEFLAILQRYPLILSSSSAPKASSKDESLTELDDWRRNKLSTEIRLRNGDPYMTKDEMVKLLKCKMKRGKFRPTLLPLLNQNTEASIESTTRHIASYYSSNQGHDPYDLKCLTRDITYLTKNLKGVGPAFASYIRPFLLPESIAPYTPAFSDEATRWILSSEDKAGKPKLAGGKNGDIWKTKLAYSAKEYYDYVGKVWEVSRRLKEEIEKDGKTKDACQFTPETVEMVGWVLGKEAQGWNPEDSEQEEETGQQ